MVGKGWLRAFAVASMGLVLTAGMAPATQAANRTSSSGGYHVTVCTASHFVRATNTCTVGVTQLTTLNQFYGAYISITGAGVRLNRAKLVMSPNWSEDFLGGTLPSDPYFCQYSSPQTHGACAGSVADVLGFVSPNVLYQLHVLLWPYRSGPVASTSLWTQD